VTLPVPAELFDLSGRVALVTGGAGNLGGVFARILAGAGATVAILDLDRAALDRRARELEGAGAQGVIALACDLADPKAITAAFGEIEQRAKRLDVLVNNAAGKSTHFMSDLEALPLEDWEQVLRVNLTAPFLCVKAAVPLMRAAGGGSIVNIASIYGIVSPDPRIYEGSALQTPPVYTASKGGIAALTRYVAVYHAKDGIRCNAITPGGVFAGQPDGFVERYSARAPLGRMARADELGGALLYLASGASSYVTGHNLVVDGGWTAW
jgi:NAD(P)-dependent dehydrogenase (short-subunit alcohol dehydrogenase family)